MAYKNIMRDLHRMGINPDAVGAIDAAQKGRCVDAFRYLYDAAPHNQTSCTSEKFEQITKDFRTAANVFDKFCVRQEKGQQYPERHALQGAGPRRRRSR